LVLPEVFEFSACQPIAVLKLPLFPYRAPCPTATFSPPVELPVSAEDPTAVFRSPFVLVVNACHPTAVLLEPVVSPIMVCHPAAVAGTSIG
jgi:hypothetical protein